MVQPRVNGASGGVRRRRPDRQSTGNETAAYEWSEGRRASEVDLDNRLDRSDHMNQLGNRSRRVGLVLPTGGCHRSPSRLYRSSRSKPPRVGS